MHSLGQDISFVGNIEVELDVVGVLLADLGVHLDVVVRLGLLILVRVQKVLLTLEVLVDLAVNLDVLQRAVEHDQHFGVDGPVVEVRDVALKRELKRA